jgi:uncharacterized protein YcfJ
MKKALVAVLVTSSALAAHGQLFSPEAIGGAFWGSFLGGLAGSDRCHGFSGRGAAIGAGVGLLVGTLVSETRRQDYYRPYGYGPQAYAQAGYGYVYQPAYAYAPARPNYTVNGTLVGALAGGLIGAADHKGWEGAGIGAASGLVVGGFAEAAAQKRDREWIPVPPPPPVALSPPPPPVPPPPTASRTAQPVVKSAPIHQIPDAPRVPDAPTF